MTDLETNPGTSLNSNPGSTLGSESEGEDRIDPVEDYNAKARRLTLLTGQINRIERLSVLGTKRQQLAKETIYL